MEAKKTKDATPEFGLVVAVYFWLTEGWTTIDEALTVAVPSSATDSKNQRIAACDGTWSQKNFSSENGCRKQVRQLSVKAIWTQRTEQHLRTM